MLLADLKSSCNILSRACKLAFTVEGMRRSNASRIQLWRRTKNVHSRQLQRTNSYRTGQPSLREDQCFRTHEIKEGSTQIVNFMTPGAGVLALGSGHISHSEYVLSSTLSIYSTLIAIVLNVYDAAFLYHG